MADSGNDTCGAGIVSLIVKEDLLMFRIRLKSGGWIYSAYSGGVLPPMLGLGTPGGKKVLMLTEENGFAITDGGGVYGGEPRYYDTSRDLVGQIKENLYEELREFCGEDNGVYSADDFKEFIFRDRMFKRDDSDIWFNEFLEACKRRIQASYYD